MKISNVDLAIKIQSHLPVVVQGSLEVVGMIPLYVSLGLTGCETEIVLAGSSMPLLWLPRNTSTGLRHIAVVPISISDNRQGKFPVFFQPNPEFLAPKIVAERSMVHFGSSMLPYYWSWLFTHGATVQPIMANPDSDSGIERWSLGMPMASSSQCTFVDVEWRGLAPENWTPIAIAVNDPCELPEFLSIGYVSEDMSKNIIGLTMAESTPIMRVYRRGTPTAGTYPVRMNLFSKDGTMRPVILELEVS